MVKDVNNNSVTATFSFTTGDVNIPMVSIVKPSHQQLSVSQSPSIELKFSEIVINVNESTITLRESSLDGTIVPIGTISNESTNNYTYTFSPKSQLKEFTKYYVVVESDISNNENIHLNKTQFEFTTGDSVAPTVSLIQPDNNSINVNKMPTIQLKFSENVPNVNESNITLRESSSDGNKVLIGTITPLADNVYSFSPESQLRELTTYYIVVESAITNEGYTHLKKTTFDFTTLTNNNLIYANQVGESGGDTLSSGVTIDKDGNTYVVGGTTVDISGQTKQGGVDYFITKYAVGKSTPSWTKQVGESGGDTLSSGVTIDKDGNIYVVGRTTVGISGQTKQGDMDYFITKYKASENDPLWTKLVGASGGITIATGVAVDKDGNTYVVGYTNVGISGQTKQGNKDYFIAKYGY